MEIHIINGPNLNLLGKRQTDIYGTVSFEDYFETLQKDFPEIDLHYFQSNSEGAIIDELHRIGFTAEGIVFNPAAFTHYSYAIADALAAITSPVIEIHISDIDNREDFRKLSVTSAHCVQQIKGMGLEGYRKAVKYFQEEKW